MANFGTSALGGAAHSAGALARGFQALAYPRCMLIMIVSAGLSIVLAIGLWFLLRWAIFDWQFFNWGWANWLLRHFGGMALFFLMLLLFPALLAIVISVFFDFIINDIERRHYPSLPPLRAQSVDELTGYIVKFTGLIMLVNLLALPFYLLFPGINLLIAWAANGYLFGRGYYEAVAMRRLAPAEMHELRRERSGPLFRAGVLVAMLKTVPFLNLLMPVVACAYFTHLFHKIDWQNRAP